jgi:hypothetical protein
MSAMIGRQHHESDLRELARQVGRLAPDWQQPERFYSARSDLAARIRRANGAPPACEGRRQLAAVIESMRQHEHRLAVAERRILLLLRAVAALPPRRRRPAAKVEGQGELPGVGHGR